MVQADHDSHDPSVHGGEETYYEKRIIALSDLLIDKGIITEQEIQDVVRRSEEQVPGIGSRVVAHAWKDSGFKQRLLEDGKETLGEMGIVITGHIQNIQVVENTDAVHHVVVCTLCSCYTTPLLGPAPEWYKSEAYRSRVVREPRRVLEEFGLELDQAMEVRVVDSTSEIRYLVVPRRPEGTEHLGEEELAALVTRDSMIGTADALTPSR